MLILLSSLNITSKQYVYNQYDSTVRTNTVVGPGSDAAVIRIHNKNKSIAVSVDSSANYCRAHPLTGGKQIVCENWRNLISVGAKPLAITNCLNFGNPEKEKNMGEFVECVEGINEASKYLDFPVVSGNVSFYNETKDKGIKPTPSIGGVGLIKNYRHPQQRVFMYSGNWQSDGKPYHSDMRVDISEIKDADLASILTQLEVLMTQKAAAQATFTRVTSKSLFDFLT